MTTFRDMFGAVYIFENLTADRIKVGMTTNNVSGRLQDVNRIWRGAKATCQICGGRRLIGRGGFFPEHVVSGARCTGGNALPLESDLQLAEMHLLSLQKLIPTLSGSDRGSAVRKANSLEKRIDSYRNQSPTAGAWVLSTAFYTERAERVELLAHKILAERLDRTAPLGEVFQCSAAEAVTAIETALVRLDLFKDARRQ